jgi:DNA repair exonuclease SbcCD nuclease subunit
VPKKDVRVWGCSFSTPYIESSLIKNINVPNDGLVNIMVMHGDFVAENTSSKYNPITKTNISYSGMDYIALGHIHHSSSVHQAGRTFYAYSGCPESQGFEETGLKGIYTGIVSKGYCNLTFRPVQYRMCITMQADITGLRNQEEIIEATHVKMKNNYGGNYANNIYRITFTGTLQTSSPVDFVQTELKLNEEIFFVQVRNYTRPDINLDEISSEMNLKGLFVKKMMAQIVSEQDTVKRINLEKSLYLGLNAFDGEVSYYEN